MKRLAYTFLLGILSAQLAFGTTWYVDNSCANNGNGTATTCAGSPGAAGPFNSIANEQAAVTGNQAGSTVLLKRGEMFREQFTDLAYGTVGNPFTLDAYGTGANPIVNGSALLVDTAGGAPNFETGTGGPQAFGWWNLSETSGTRADGNTTNADNLTPTNAVGHTSGPNVWTANSATFDGSTEYLSRANASLHSGFPGLAGGSITAGCWIYISSAGTIMSLAANGSNSNAWGLFLQNGVINFVVWPGGSAAYSNSPYSTSQWYHVVGRYVNGGEISIFVNGVKQTVTQTSASMAASTSDLMLGDNAYWGYFGGRIAQPFVIGTNLSDVQIASIYNYGLDGSGSNISWTNQGSNVWSYPLATQTYSVLFNGVRGIPVASQGAVTSASDWFWRSGNLYVYSTSDPSTVWTSPGVEAAQKSSIDFIHNDYITVNNIDAEGGNTNGGVWASSRTGITFNSVNSYLSYTGFYLDASTTTCNGCTANYNTDQGFTTHTSGTNTFNNSTAHDNWNEGFEGNDAETENLNNCIAYNNGYYPALYSGDGHGLAMHGTTTSTVKNFLAYGNYGSGAAWVLGATGTMYNSTLYDNVDLDAAMGWGIEYEPTSAVTLISKNNITSNHNYELYKTAQAGSSLVSDYNDYFGSGATPYYYNGTAYSWAGYKSASSQDAHSYDASPQFANAGAANFQLQATSPACYSGTNVSLTQDILGNTVIPGFVSMGAYQCQPRPGVGGVM